MISRSALTAGIFLLSACTHSIHQVNVSDFQPYPSTKNGQMVKATAEQFTILGFVYDTDYVDRAKKELIQQCPSGQLTGITTEISTSHGFFSWTNRAVMQGLCVSPVARGRGSKLRKGT